MHPGLDRIVDEARCRGSVVLFPRRKGGTPMSAQDFRAMFYRELARPEFAPIRAAGLPPHGFCAGAHNKLLEAGCSTAEVSAITGRSLQMVERCARARDQEKLARRAMAPVG